MPIVIPGQFTSQEIRVLQEFRRLSIETLTIEHVRGIRHPVGGGDAPAEELVAKGYLTRAGDEYALTDSARQFLAYDPKPDSATPGDPPAAG